ncbi:unnamed protein product [Paramecium sonneborni]|uniref:Transmembrane protein n=1 Tax=Paramecium sonneborni TaxID=65129 RepID=A0A8S1RM38_9CILI|nr:unnamed protein product [Paramecium sonneborni]
MHIKIYNCKIHQIIYHYHHHILHYHQQFHLHLYLNMVIRLFNYKFNNHQDINISNQSTNHLNQNFHLHIIHIQLFKNFHIHAYIHQEQVKIQDYMINMLLNTKSKYYLNIIYNIVLVINFCYGTTLSLIYILLPQLLLYSQYPGLQEHCNPFNILFVVKSQDKQPLIFVIKQLRLDE